MNLELTPETYYRVEERYGDVIMAAERIGRAEAGDLTPDPDDLAELLEGIEILQRDPRIPDAEKEAAVTHILAARASEWHEELDDEWLFGSH